MIVRRDEKVRLISRVPLFKACSQAELARIATVTTQLDLPKGEVLFREGTQGDDFFVLVKGSADVRKGKQHVATLKAGDFVGEIALLSDAPRTATVTLTSPVTALRATRKGFSELLKTAPSIRQKLLTTLAERRCIYDRLGRAAISGPRGGTRCHSPGHAYDVVTRLRLAENELRAVATARRIEGIPNARAS